MKQNITYRSKQIKVDVPYKIRKGVCLACGTKGWTNLHHWKYEYGIKEIRKNKALALKNTTELCFPCHDLANALKLLHSSSKELLDKLEELRLEALKSK